MCRMVLDYAWTCRGVHIGDKNVRTTTGTYKQLCHISRIDSIFQLPNEIGFLMFNGVLHHVIGHKAGCRVLFK